MTTLTHNKYWRDDLLYWTSPVLANMLWGLLCLPVMTIPLAFVGLFAMVYHWLTRQHTQTFKLFFGTIQRVWWKAYRLCALNLAVGGFLLLNLYILLWMDNKNIIAYVSLGATLFSAVFVLAASVLAWVLVAIWDAPLVSILKLALRLAILHPFISMGAGLLFVSPFVVSLVMPVAVFVVITGVLAAAIACHTTQYLLLKHFMPDTFLLLDIT